MAAPRSRLALALSILVLAAWVYVSGAAVANSTLAPPKAPWLQALRGGASESQQKGLNPQLLAYFLRPLATYLATLTGTTGTGAAPNYDDYGAAAPAPAAFTAPVSAKLPLLTALLGLGGLGGGVGGGVGGGANNPSYPRAR